MGLRGEPSAEPGADATAPNPATDLADDLMNAANGRDNERG